MHHTYLNFFHDRHPYLKFSRTTTPIWTFPPPPHLYLVFFLDHHTCLDLFFRTTTPSNNACCGTNNPVCGGWNMRWIALLNGQICRAVTPHYIWNIPAIYAKLTTSTTTVKPEQAHLRVRACRTIWTTTTWGIQQAPSLKAIIHFTNYFSPAPSKCGNGIDRRSSSSRPLLTYSCIL